MSLTDKFDRNRKIGKKTSEPENVSEQGEVENFVKAGAMRNISFVMLDGSKEFFSYSDLSRCAYQPDAGQLVLTFRGFCAVTLKGQNLDLLYERLQDQIPKQVKCLEKRYKDLKTEKDIYVTEIIVTEIQI